MNYRENDIKVRLMNLKKAVDAELENIHLLTEDYYNRAKEKYAVLIQAADDLLDLYHESEQTTPVKWYEYRLIDGEGVKVFEQKYGELISVPEAISLLGFGINEQILRNILHLTDYIVAVKAKLPKAHSKLRISKKSVLDFKKALVLNPGLLLGLKSSCKKGMAPLEAIITTDKELEKELEPFVIPVAN